MTTPLMPKATALWLVENTALTFDQIAKYCQLHPLEVQALADGEIYGGMSPLDPIVNNQLSQEEIDRCQNDSSAELQGLERSEEKVLAKKRKGGRYTPVSKRRDKPDAILWLLKNAPDLTNSQITRLLGTTNTTINAIREKTHRHSSSLRARNPVALGLCTQKELDDALGIKLDLGDDTEE